MRVKLIFTQINTWNLFLKNENPPNVVVAKPQRVRDAIYAILATLAYLPLIVQPNVSSKPEGEWHEKFGFSCRATS